MNINFRIRSNIKHLQMDMARAVQDTIAKSCLLMESEVKRTLSGTRSGKVYKLPRSRRTWQASAPFQPPAVRLGQLRQRYTHRIKGSGWNTVGYVGNPLKYAEFLEFGTRKMAIRPHLRKTFHEKRRQLRALWGNIL